jgi:sugar/nucleoside kinase (ribokinase family)
MARRTTRSTASGSGNYGRGADDTSEEEGAQPLGSALVAVHGTIVSVLVCTLGDLLLDVIVRTEDVAGPDAEGNAETRVGAGGQSANVAAWAVELGAEARFVGKRANDAAAQVALAELEARGVEVLGPSVEGRNGVVVSLVDGDGRRTMLSDRGVAPLLRAEELEMAWLRGCGALHLSGYSLFRNPIAEAAAKAAGAVQALGGRLTVDLSSAAGIQASGRDAFLRRLELLRPDVVFGNESELEALGTEPPAATVIVKRGAEGFTVDGRVVPALPAEVVDTTGAGDALAAGYIVGGPELAAEAAARCVAKLGTMP